MESNKEGIKARVTEDEMKKRRHGAGRNKRKEKRRKR